MGRNYVAWGLIRVSPQGVLTPYRHGKIVLPEDRSAYGYGETLLHVDYAVQHAIDRDLRPDFAAAERFTYRPGAQGRAAEGVNLLVSRLVSDPRVVLVRNTDWKSWAQRHFGLPKKATTEGLQALFGTPTPHEADALGIACFEYHRRLTLEERASKKTRARRNPSVNPSQGSTAARRKTKR